MELVNLSVTATVTLYATFDHHHSVEYSFKAAMSMFRVGLACTNISLVLFVKACCTMLCKCEITVAC